MKEREEIKEINNKKETKNQNNELNKFTCLVKWTFCVLTINLLKWNCKVLFCQNVCVRSGFN